MKYKLLAFITFLGFAASCNAENIYMGVNFSDNSISNIYKIQSENFVKKTANKKDESLGFVFSSKNEVEAYFIDNYKNHRIILKKDSTDNNYNISKSPIYRQIFDGLAKDADCGRSGYPTSYDSRDKIIAGEGGKALYRTLETPFSAGLGNAIPKEKAKLGLITNECLEIDDKNWYSIPNGSWYQSWLSDKTASATSYKIFYDRWEEKLDTYIEEFWRGNVIYRAFDRDICNVPTKKLYRAEIDGALEEVENGSLKIVLDVSYKKGFFMLPGNVNKDNVVGCYFWEGTSKGQFSIPNVKPIYESSEPENRFVCYGTSITGVRKFYVLGTDILRQWLAKYSFPADKAECSDVAFTVLDKSWKSMIFVYSKPEKCIYRFIIDENNEVKVGLPKVIKIKEDIVSMHCSSKGNLFFVPEFVDGDVPTFDTIKESDMKACLVLNVVADNIDIGTGSVDVATLKEAMFKDKSIKGKRICDVDCRVIISKNCYQKIYKLPFGSDEIQKLDYELLLGTKNYYFDVSCKKFNAAKFDGGLDVLIYEAKKPGNLISSIKDKVPGYSDTLLKPKKILLTSY